MGQTGAGTPSLVLVREPDQLRVERTHPQLAFGVRLVELAEPDRHVADDDERGNPPETPRAQQSALFVS
jgi:hypothetical protein